MKKKLLLLATVLTASVNLAFAQGNNEPALTMIESDDQNITYTYGESNVTTTAVGASSIDEDNYEYETSVSGNVLTVHIQDYTAIAYRKRTINLTVFNIANYDILPNILPSFTREPIPGEGKTVRYLNTKLEQYATFDEVDERLIVFQTPEAQEMYDSYKFACLKARDNGDNIKSGTELKELGINSDVDGFDIEDNFYYYKSLRAKKWTMIETTNGYYKTGETYYQCVDTYVPTTVGANITMPIVGASAADNKVGIVTGVIDVARFNSIVSAKNYLNYDFTTANIVGTIKSSSVTDNYLAYFIAEANAEGNNIVNGANCENYNIADDGTEIKVYKQFSAKNIDYTRNISAGKYYSITVPFDFTNKSDYFSRTSTFKSCYTNSKNELKARYTIGVWEANMPMFCKANATTSVLSLSNLQGIQVKETIAKSWAGDEDLGVKGHYTGNYQPIAKGDLEDAYIISLTGDAGKMPINSERLKPGRAYITVDKSTAAKFDNISIELVDEDGTVETIDVNEETTGIDGVTENATTEVENSQFASVDGKISSTPNKGINIVKSTLKNGKTSTKKVVY